MKCPHCRGRTHVINSRPDREHGWYVWRRRECLTCGHRFDTVEQERTA
jgi:transcriptional regulator NrdR family protein